MPPGASLLMKGLGMREIDRHIKGEKKGRKYSGEYDRPKWFFHDGVNYRVPPEYHSNVPCTSDPVDDYGMLSPETQKYLDKPGRSSEGLGKDPVRGTFELDRSQWRSLGFISPYEGVQGRIERDQKEYVFWLFHNRERVEEMMNQDFDERDWPYNYLANHAQRRRSPLRVIEHAHRRNPRTPHERHDRFARIDNRPHHRAHGSFDPRDPKNRPPVPPNARNFIPRVTNRLSSSLYRNAGSRHPHQYPTDIRLPSSRTNRASYPAYGIYGYGERPGRLGPHIVDNRGHRLRGRNPFINGDELQDEGRPEFITPHRGFRRQPRIHRPHHFLDDDEDEDEDEEDVRSQFSTRSYTRHRDNLSPEIMYPHIGPHHGRPLGLHHNYEFDDEDELYRPIGEYVRRRRDPYGIGIGRVRDGRRGYGREDLDYDFSDDEDELLLYH